MVGMWAVAKHNAQGAKLFMWSRLPLYLLELLLIAMRRNKFKQHDMGEVWRWVSFSDLSSLFFCAYYLKVSTRWRSA